ncbi:uncharacterized protein MONOS_4475 [Monocercomonoides exilis]|uniref:uncharacterized protein n=1 Tax=Monocercomonoides exilis TaxID=2049356 RepID=UPI00355A57FE|nr:hypothetical protein MONOS_4475 [Monocercomonoides exilis]|eukprot:MONOS_4475.1-p1 / transcript=MONOS_4475.1 / gene=MONOS_4475 / organism=Monocercomonoides_exilis_PA203 / gene_product=unspecified product / transcript_product=unspecified product / location=Mono_scaffold00119:72710-73632(-) / protein_length=239 / sequence_SO=supercontig / SO=protein_coding / is_pseudo=false
MSMEISSTPSAKAVKKSPGVVIIPGSMRPDGTYRKETRMKAGYLPPEFIPKYSSASRNLSSCSNQRISTGSPISSLQQKRPKVCGLTQETYNEVIASMIKSSQEATKKSKEIQQAKAKQAAKQSAKQVAKEAAKETTKETVKDTIKETVTKSTQPETAIETKTEGTADIEQYSDADSIQRRIRNLKKKVRKNQEKLQSTEDQNEEERSLKETRISDAKDEISALEAKLASISSEPEKKS